MTDGPEACKRVLVRELDAEVGCDVVRADVPVEVERQGEEEDGSARGWRRIGQIGKTRQFYKNRQTKASRTRNKVVMCEQLSESEARNHTSLPAGRGNGGWA